MRLPLTLSIRLSIRLMVCLITCIVALSTSHSKLEAQNPRTKSQELKRIDPGVTIHWTLERGMFPKEWVAPPENMHATPLHISELNRALNVLGTAVKRYPADIVRSNLKDIFLVDELYDVGEQVGGMENGDDNSMYLCNDRETSDEFLASVFHHEFAHLLLDHNEGTFGRKAWLGLNPQGFHYGKGGIDSIKKRQDSDEPDETYWKRGFLCQYATSDLDEDFASLAEYLFTARPTFWNRLDRFPILKAKVERVISFYHTLDAHITRDWFRQLADKRKLLKASP